PGGRDAGRALRPVRSTVDGRVRTMTQLAEAAATTRRSRVLPLLAIAITVVLWASAFVAIRYVGRDVSAGPMALARLLVASILLGLWVFLTDRSSRRRGGDGSSAISAGSTHPQPLRRWPDRRGWLLLAICGAVWFGGYNRSEEHTSELQSRENLVCRLLLEK